MKNIDYEYDLIKKSSKLKADSAIAKFFLTDGFKKFILLIAGLFLISFLFSFIIIYFLYASSETRDNSINLQRHMYREDIRYKHIDKIIEYTPENPIDAYNFYFKHLSYGVPFILRGFMNDWKAIKFWPKEEYFLEKLGSQTIEVEARTGESKEFAFFKKGYTRVNMTYQEFLSLYKREDLDQKYYWAEQKLPSTLEKDLGDILFANFLNLEAVNIWQGAIGTISLPHMDARDNFLCQISGYKELIIISPTQTKHLYVKPDEDWPSNYSPVDFFEPDYDKYPDFKNVRMKFHVQINQGDILFLPSYWWHHIKSSKGNNIAINYWFTNNYMIDLFMAYVQGD